MKDKYTMHQLHIHFIEPKKANNETRLYATFGANGSAQVRYLHYIRNGTVNNELTSKSHNMGVRNESDHLEAKTPSKSK